MKQSDVSSWVNKGRNIMVHKYFKEALELVLPEIQPFLGANKKYIFTGHSLGGSLSGLLAFKTTAMVSARVWNSCYRK